MTTKKPLTNSLASPGVTLWHTILSTERFQYTQLHALRFKQGVIEPQYTTFQAIKLEQRFELDIKLGVFFFAFIRSPTERANKLLRHERSDAGKLSLSGHSDYDVDTQMINDFASSQLVRLPTYTTAVLDRTAHVQCTPSCSPWVNVSL